MKTAPQYRHALIYVLSVYSGASSLWGLTDTTTFVTTWLGSGIGDGRVNDLDLPDLCR